MEIKPMIDQRTNGITTSVYMSITEMDIVGKECIRLTIDKIASTVADEFLKLHMNELLSSLDVQAVANLCIAQSGAGIREALEKQIPKETRVIHHHDKEVYQRGIFGGLTKI